MLGVAVGRRGALQSDHANMLASRYRYGHSWPVKVIDCLFSRVCLPDCIPNQCSFQTRLFKMQTPSKPTSRFKRHRNFWTSPGYSPAGLKVRRYGQEVDMGNSPGVHVTTCAGIDQPFRRSCMLIA